jgi:hypothetical protein
MRRNWRRRSGWRRSGRGHALDGNVSRQLKRQIGRARDGRRLNAPPARRARPRSREERLNRILLIGGGGLAIGAVMLAVLAPRFDAGALAINLAAIALGLLMGKGIGMFFFRRVYPTTSK